MLNYVKNTTNENNDVVDSIDELRREMGLDGPHNKRSSFILDRGTLLKVVEVSCSQIGGHDDNCIPYVNNPALPICESAVIQDLQEEGDEFPGGFLYLINQNDGIWLATDVLRELPALIITDITGRRSNQSRDRMLFRILRSINTDHSIW